MNMTDTATGRPGTLTNSTFLQHLAQGAGNGQWLWVDHFVGDPSKSTGWGGQPYRLGAPDAPDVDGWGRYNAYFSVACLQAVDGEVHRRMANFARLGALVLDDYDLDDLLELTLNAVDAAFLPLEDREALAAYVTEGYIHADA